MKHRYVLTMPLALSLNFTFGCTDSAPNQPNGVSAAGSGAGAAAGAGASAGIGGATAGGGGLGATGGAAGATGGGGGISGSGGTGPEFPSIGCEKGYAEISNGVDGVNVEQVCYSQEMGFDKAASLAAFQTTLYPLLRENCAFCHSNQTQGQAPLHSDSNVELAHDYALTRVNFRKPENSKFVVRMGIDRHNCFGGSCSTANTAMLQAVEAWAAAVTPGLTPTPRLTPEGEQVSEAQVLEWIAADRAANVQAADAEFVKYASLHEIHNSGVSADEMNVARVGLSKALNSTARWAPAIVNPVDVNGKGIVYRFDTRHYWGYNKGVTKLHFGGSDDDVFFGRTSVNYLGEAVGQNITTQEKYDYTAEVEQDPSFAKLVWGRVLAGNVEGATDSGVLPPYVDGFKAEYVEASQLVYTLTRPDVYNSIMAIPWYAQDLEKELGVDISQGTKSYQYVLTKQAITVDSRLYWRARTKSGGFYWKTWDVFSGQLPNNISDIDEAYAQGAIRFPFWANPIPKFIAGTGGGVTPETFSFIATLAQPYGTEPEGCDGQPNFGGSQFLNCRYYTGTSGLQQSAEEVIWNLPNGLQGYSLWGGFNQRRVDAFVNIVRDPRIVRDATDAQLTSRTDFATADRRLNTGSSCIGCHADGMNRGNNDLRDWLDGGGALLPTGEHGVDKWIDDASVVAEVKELYPPSSVMRPQMEDDRRIYMAATAKIKHGMIAGPDKNTYVEPTIWTIEWSQGFYKYPPTRSN